MVANAGDSVAACVVPICGGDENYWGDEMNQQNLL